MTKRDWLERRYKETPERPVRFSTVSDMEVAPLYTAEDAADSERIGLPGEFPYTRGVYSSMESRSWSSANSLCAATAVPDEAGQRQHAIT